MMRVKLGAPLSLLIMMAACSSGFDNSRYYAPSFEPDPLSVPICPHADVNVSEALGWVVVVQPPQYVTGCGPSETGYFAVYDGKISTNWRALDGGGGMAGTAYSMKSLLPDERQREQAARQPAPGSVYFVPDQVEERSSFMRNGLNWEHMLIREYTTFPREPDGINAPGEPWLQRFKDVYVYRHPEGWWLRVQASFSPGMERHPDLLRSRRHTLRQVVDSIQIEPKDPSRISCVDNGGRRQSCRYLWSQPTTG